MKQVTLPFHNLRRHLLRSALTSIGVGAALAGLLALVGFSRGLDRNWIVSLRDKGTHILALKKGAIDLLSARLDESLTARMRAVPGVVSVIPGLGDLIELETGEMAYLTGFPLDSDFWKNLVITEGRRPGPPWQEEVVLGQALALLLHKHPGDAIELNGRMFTVTSIAKQPSALDDRSVMMPLDAMQRLLGREGSVSGFHIRIDRPEDSARMSDMIARLSSEFTEIIFIESGEVANNSHVTRLLHAISWGSSTIALAMAFVIVLNTLLMSVSERTQEIGLLSAIGWQASRIITMVVVEGLLMAAAGAVLGVGFGMLGLRWMMSHRQIGALVQPEVTPMLIAEAVALACLIGALGGIYPAWRATRQRPVRLLRSD